MSSKSIRSSVAAALAGAAVVLLAGCGATAPAPAPSLTGGAKANGDLTIASCQPGAGTRSATGSVTNTGDADADYVVRIDWLDGDGKVVGSGWDEVDAVAAGADADWSVDADLGDVESVSCTTNLTRGTK